MKGLLGDFVFYGFAKALAKSLSLITFPLIASRLSVEDYGWFDYNIYLFSVVGTLLLMGLDSGVVRFGNDARFKDYQGQLISTPIFFFAITISLFAIIYIAIRETEWLVVLRITSTKDSVIIFIGAVGYTLTMYSLTVLRLKFLKLKYFIIGTFLPISMLLSLAVLIATGTLNSQNILLATCIIYLVNGMLGAYAINMHFQNRILQRHNIKILLSYSLPMGIIVLSGLILPLLERSYLLSYGLASDLGIYSAGQKIALIYGLPIIVFQTAFFPRFFKNIKENIEGDMLDIIMKALVVLFAIFAVTIDFTSELMIKILAGEEYMQAAIVVSYLIIGQYLVFIGTFCGIGTVIIDKSYYRLIIYVASTSAFFISMLVFPNESSLIKILTAGLVSRIFFLVCEVILSRKLMPISWTYNLIAIALLWVFMMVFWFDVRIVGFWGVFLSFTLFIVVSGLFFKRSDLQILRKVFTFGN